MKSELNFEDADLFYENLLDAHVSNAQQLAMCLKAPSDIHSSPHLQAV